MMVVKLKNTGWRIVDFITKGERSLIFSMLGTLLFFAVAYFNILHHEMWRDELQAWLIGRDSTSVADLLFKNVRYEGHPALWHLGLFFITRFTANPFFMQVYNILLSCIAVFLFLHYSPFNKLQKIFFVFGYYMLYEYGTISRNYAIGLVFLFAVPVIYLSKSRFKPIFTAVALFFLCQTNVYQLILALCLTGYFFLDHLLEPQKRSQVPGKKVQYLLAVFIILVGVAVSAVQLIPPTDSGYASEWNLGWNPQRAVSVIEAPYKSFIPIPQNTLHFWDSNVITAAAIHFVSSILLLGFAVWILKRTRLELLLFLGGTITIMAFMYVKYYGFNRHYGHMFILLVTALWLSKGKLDQAGDGAKPKRFQSVILTLLLLCNCYAGFLASYLDWQYVFSYGSTAADYIKKEGLENHLLVGDTDYAAITVAGFLSKKIFYPRSHRFGSFIIWNNRRDIIGFLQAIKAIEALPERQLKRTIIVLNFILHRKLYKHVKEKLRYLAGFTGSVVINEKYYIWELKR